MTTIIQPPPPLEQLLKMLAENVAWQQKAVVTITIDGPGGDYCQYTIGQKEATK